MHITSYNEERVIKPAHKAHINIVIRINSLKPGTLAQVKPSTSLRLDEGLTPTKDEGTCLRRLSMFRKEVH